MSVNVDSDHTSEQTWSVLLQNAYYGGPCLHVDSLPIDLCLPESLQGMLGSCCKHTSKVGVGWTHLAFEQAFGIPEDHEAGVTQICDLQGTVHLRLLLRGSKGEQTPLSRQMVRQDHEMLKLVGNGVEGRKGSASYGKVGLESSKD